MLTAEKAFFLDELSLNTGELPFSFSYGGNASSSFLPTWTREVRAETSGPGTARHTITYTDPVSGLQVRCMATRFTAYPAVEWVLSFRNTGAADTPLLECILPLDVRVTTSGENVMLYHAHGSTCAATDFLPLDEPIAPKRQMDIAPNGGRSSDGVLPFFNLGWDTGGLVGAIGWSGQWALQLERDENAQVTLQAGQQTTHLILHPGEEIRTPRILLISWQGADRLHGHNLLRKVILDHYTPRINGEIALPPVTENTWFVFNTGNDVTEENQLAAMPSMAKAGVEGYWLDAGWFEGGWPAGAGSWVPKKAAFPRGLKPIGDAAHQLGMQFVLWFEPERVTTQSLVAKEHPEWVMHHLNEGEWGALYNLGNPDARKWLTDFLSQCITDWDIDIYRNDFNVAPLPFWRAADAADRQGMAEIRYIEGLYALWDELRARHPKLTIDNCASGGRRIDLETTSRSYPLWQSDTQCHDKVLSVWDQGQNAGLSLYVPLHAAGVWAFDPYTFRSVATTGCSVCVDITEAQMEAAQQMIAEAKALRPYYLGDYYPLLGITTHEQFWCAWQYDRPDLGQGFVMCFRREGSPFPSAELQLHGLEAAANYRLT
ncbi:MAG TPA: alpha-galactosidase, partial [Armatimonadota bacterium]